ncbi:unnamed protein product [Microthlaspi erraticum]|uniref:Uncharacterized protein n=1 Tax=Microthlaspi erraticum TaxID=1685480 RepID=A0A6D2IAW1_9BRAS|nr:unnamed protein product [Microthlaspi erraticum]
MHSNFARHVIGCAVRAREENIIFDARDVKKLYSVKHNTRFPWSFYTSPRMNRRVLTNTPIKDSSWNDESFFFKVNRASIGEFDFERLPKEWATSLVCESVPNNSSIEYLVARLGREKTNWNLFTT